MAIMLLMFAIQSVIALPLDTDCKKDIMELPQCILGPLEHCFEDNGCKIPIKGSWISAAGASQKSGGNESETSCLSDIQSRVMDPFEKCLSREIPNGHFTRLGNLFSNVQSLGSLPKNPLDILKKVIDLACGPKADKVFACAKSKGSSLPTEAFACYGKISAACQNELLKIACECSEEVINKDPKVIEDTISCLKGSSVNYVII